jgi:hypothetical protein
VSRRVVFTLACVLGAVALGAACKQGPELTCRVNEQCFVCPDEKAKAACVRDPTTSRCKWAEPSHCAKK